MTSESPSFDVCIVCALYEEAKAVLEEIAARCMVSFAPAFSRIDSYEYRYTTIHNTKGEPLTVLVTWLADSGPVRTSLDLKPLLQEFHPRFAAMAGICAGYRGKIRLGDLVVAQYAYHYEEGKILAGSDGQPKHLPEMKTYDATTQVIHYARGLEVWEKPVTEMKLSKLKRQELKGPQRPKRYIAPMASGMAVRGDNPFPWLVEYQNRKTIALDMEAAAFYLTLRGFPGVHALVVKGVCDYADMTKNDTYHDYAARASAIYLLTFIQEYVTEETMPRRDDHQNQGGGDPIRLSSISQFQQIDSIELYLETLQDFLSKLPEYFRSQDSFDFTSIRQKVRLSTQRLLSYKQEKQSNASKRPIVSLREDEETYQHSMIKNIYQHKGDIHEETELLDWEKLRKQQKRAVILGDPGLGKSWLLKYEGYLTVQEQRAILQREGQERVIVPVYVNLATLAEELTARQLDFYPAVLSALQKTLAVQFTPHFKNWLQERFAHSQFLFLLDALDEVADDEQRKPLHTALSHLAQTTRCHILLTARLSDYHQAAPFTLANGQPPPEYELVPLSKEQTASFITTWFTSRPERGQWLLERLRWEPTLRIFARIPLLLSFLCLIASGERNEEDIPLQRGKLYETVLRHLLGGSWRSSQLQMQGDQGPLLEKLDLLRYIGWHFADHKGRFSTLIPSEDLNRVIHSAPQERYLLPYLEKKYPGQEKQGLILELSVRDGILIQAGKSDQSIHHTQVPFLFLHRTLHEYLAASYLARQSVDYWREAVLAHCWFNADWTEVIVLLAGCLDDPNPLLESLLNEPYDAFGRMSLLAGRCLAEVDRKRADGGRAVRLDLEEEILKRLWLLLYSFAEVHREEVIGVLVQIGQPAVTKLLDTLHRLDASYKKILVPPELHNRRLHLHKAVIWALGQIGDPLAVKPLLTMLHNRERYGEWAQELIEALGEIGDPRAEDELFACMKIFGFWTDTRNATAEALGKMANPQIVERLLVMLCEGDSEEPKAAATALGYCGELALEGLLTVALDRSRENISAYSGAVKALGRIGGQRAEEALLDILIHEDDEYRCGDAIEALGEIGDPHTMNLLLQAAERRSSLIRRRAVKALGGLGEPQVAEPLLTIIQQEMEKEGYYSDGELLAEAVKVLKSYGSLHNGEIPIKLLESLRNGKGFLEAEELRRTLVEVLGDIGGPLAVKAILEELQDLRVPDHELHRLMRERALKALAKNGELAVPGLLDTLQRYHMPDLQTRIIEVLGRIGDRRAVDPLLAVLAGEEAIRDMREVDPLLALFAREKTTRDMREAAAWALKQMNDPQAIAQMRQILWEGKQRDTQSDAMRGVLEPDEETIKFWLRKLRQDGGWFLVDEPEQVLDQLQQRADPEKFYEALLHAWSHWPLDRLLKRKKKWADRLDEGWAWSNGKRYVVPPRSVRTYLYWLLLQLGPRLHQASGTTWPDYRRRLLKPTNYMVTHGLRLIL